MGHKSFRKYKNVAREVCTGEVPVEMWKKLLLQLSGSAGKKLTMKNQGPERLVEDLRQRQD